MGGERLYDRVCRLHPDRGGARRSARRPTYLHGRICAVHARIHRLRPRARRHQPDRAPRHPGPGGSRPRSELACVAEPYLCRCQATRACGGSLGRRREPRFDCRPLRRRHLDRAGRLARHLLCQRAHWSCGTLAREDLCAGDAAPCRPLGRPGRGRLRRSLRSGRSQRP